MDQLLVQINAKGLQPAIGKILAFVFFSSHLRKDALLAQEPSHPPGEAPLILPPAIILFLSRVCGMPEREVKLTWETVKDIVWSENEFI